MAVCIGIPLAAEWQVRTRILPKVSARLGRRVAVSDLRVGWGRVELRGLIVDGGGGKAAPPVVVPQLRARFSMSSLFGRIRMQEVELDRPRIDLVRGEGVDDN